jgi:nucleoside-diphosphate-sugar epimerase
MRILLTGAGGFVGANVAGVLAATFAGTAAAGGQPGARLIAADLTPPHADAIRLLAPAAEHITWVTLDVRDRAALRELVAQEGVTHIVHGAAITALPDEEAARAVEIVDVNLGSTINVLAVAAVAPGVEQVLVLSSSGVYAVPPHGRLGKGARRQPEEAELALDGLYSITKRGSELLAARFAQLTGKKMAAVRLPAVYGPLERPSATRPGTSTMHRLMEALRRGRAITVTGPQIGRDWTYVADVGAAIAHLLAAPAWHYSVYNVSCGHRYTFREVVAAFAAHGLQATWVRGEERADVAMRQSHERLPLDTQRLRRDTGFTPRYDLAGGIAAWLAAEPLP